MHLKKKPKPNKPTNQPHTRRNTQRIQPDLGEQTAEIRAQRNNSNILKEETQERVPAGERTSFAEWALAENKDTCKSTCRRKGQIQIKTINSLHVDKCKRKPHLTASSILKKV